MRPERPSPTLTTIQSMGSVITLDGVVPICCSNGLSVPSGYRRVDTIGMVANPSMFSSPDAGTRGAGVPALEDAEARLEELETVAGEGTGGGARADADADAAAGVLVAVGAATASAKSGTAKADWTERTIGDTGGEDKATTDTASPTSDLCATGTTTSVGVGVGIAIAGAGAVGVVVAGPMWTTGAMVGNVGTAALPALEEAVGVARPRERERVCASAVGTGSEEPHAIDTLESKDGNRSDDACNEQPSRINRMAKHGSILQPHTTTYHCPGQCGFDAAPVPALANPCRVHLTDSTRLMLLDA